MHKNVSLQLQLPFYISILNLDYPKRNEKVLLSPLIQAPL